MAKTTDIQEVRKAIESGKIVQTELAGRNVNVNAISIDANGDAVARWSHRDNPESHLDTLDNGTEYTIYEHGKTAPRR